MRLQGQKSRLCQTIYLNMSYSTHTFWPRAHAAKLCSVIAFILQAVKASVGDVHLNLVPLNCADNRDQTVQSMNHPLCARCLS